MVALPRIWRAVEDGHIVPELMMRQTFAIELRFGNADLLALNDA